MNIVNQYSVEEVLKYEIANLYDFEITEQDVIMTLYSVSCSEGNAFTSRFLEDRGINPNDILIFASMHGIHINHAYGLPGWIFDTWHDAETAMNILIRCLVNRVMGRKVIPDEPYFKLCSEAIQKEIYAADKTKNDN
jgi:hypothetical protein